MGHYVSLPYKPTNGFFDLTERPKGMTVTLHNKIQLMQMDLVRESQKYKDPEVRRNNRVNFEKLREYMAQLQSIIINYWSHEMLFKGRNELETRQKPHTGAENPTRGVKI